MALSHSCVNDNTSRDTVSIKRSNIILLRLLSRRPDLIPRHPSNDNQALAAAADFSVLAFGSRDSWRYLGEQGTQMTACPWCLPCDAVAPCSVKSWGRGTPPIPSLLGLSEREGNIDFNELTVSLCYLFASPNCQFTSWTCVPYSTLATLTSRYACPPRSLRLKQGKEQARSWNTHYCVKVHNAILTYIDILQRE